MKQCHVQMIRLIQLLSFSYSCCCHSSSAQCLIFFCYFAAVNQPFIVIQKERRYKGGRVHFSTCELVHSKGSTHTLPHSFNLFMIWPTIHYHGFRIVVDRTLGLPKLRPNFLPMYSQFGFPQRMSELSKFCSTFFNQFLHKWRAN